MRDTSRHGMGGTQVLATRPCRRVRAVFVSRLLPSQLPSKLSPVIGTDGLSEHRWTTWGPMGVALQVLPHLTFTSPTSVNDGPCPIAVASTSETRHQWRAWLSIPVAKIPCQRHA
ncbi:hypothetical protein MRX96_001884 [Rhipicephalus microplus]